MLSLVIACWAGYVVVECLCRWHDAKHGITGIYEFPADSVHRRDTRAVCGRYAGRAVSTLLAVLLALLLDARVAFWSRAAALADRVQHVAAARFGRAVRRRYP